MSPRPLPPRTRSPALAVPVGLVLALAVGLAVRLAQLWWAYRYAPDFDQPILDARVHDYWARALASGNWSVPDAMDDPQIGSTPYYRPPGYPWTLSLLYRVGGFTILYAKLIQALVGVAGVASTWWLARRVAPAQPSVATVAALLVALSPALVFFEGELVATSWAMVWTTLLTALALRPVAALEPSPGGIGADDPADPAGRSEGAAEAADLPREEAERAPPRGRRWAPLGLGLLLGGACLFRPNLLVLALPLWLASTFWPTGRRTALHEDDADGEARVLSATGRLERPPAFKPWAPRSLQALLAIAIGVLAVTAPVTVRNLVRGGEAVWISMNGPITALYGNHAQADGHSVRVPTTGILAGVTSVSAASYPALRERVSRDEGRDVSFAELGGRLRQEVVNYIREHPGDWLALTGRKALLAVGPMEVSNNKQVALELEASPVLRWLPGRWWLLASLATLGAVALLLERRRRELTVVVSAAVLVVGATVPFLAAARFRAPVLGLLAVLAAYGIAGLRDAIRRADRRRLVAFGVAGVVGTLLFAVPWTNYAPDLSRWHLDRADAWIARGDDAAALDALRRSLAAEPTSSLALRTRGLLYARRGDATLAVQDLQASINAGGGVASRAALAALLTAQGRVDASTLELFEALLKEQPGNIGARYNYGVALFAAGRLPEARAAYERVLATRPEHTDALNNLGRTLLAEGQWAAAIARFDQVRAVQPSHVEARFNRAIALARLNPAQAVAAYRALLADVPDHVAAQTNLGALLLDRGEAKEARVWFAKVAAASPTPASLFNLSRACWTAGDESAAIEALKQARAAREQDERAPGPGRAPLELAYAERLIDARDPSLRNPAEAERLARVFVEGSRWGHPIPLRLLARALSAQGKTAESNKASSRAAELCQQAAGTFGGACEGPPTPAP